MEMIIKSNKKMHMPYQLGRAVMAYANLWPDWIIKIEIKQKYFSQVSVMSSYTLIEMGPISSPGH